MNSADPDPESSGAFAPSNRGPKDHINMKILGSKFWYIIIWYVITWYSIIR